MNDFFKRLVSRPVLMYKFVISLLFIVLGLVFFFTSPYGFSGNKSMSNVFAGLMVLYGCFRFYTFYNDYKREEQ